MATPRAWTWEEDKLFEQALVEWPEDVLDRWAIIAAQLPGGRSATEVWHHYQALVADVEMIDRGMVDMPDCWGDPDGEDGDEDDEVETSSGGHQRRRPDGGGQRGGRKGEKRKRAVLWTKKEHMLFLEGLEKYGRGDWKNISRCSVRSRTPTQVASHAQKYFIRQSQNPDTSGGHSKTKRKSINDITR